MIQDNYNKVVDYILKNQEKFYRLAYTYARNENDALDIVQNAICKALENYSSIRNTDYLKTWFYRILVNESINYIHKNRREILSDSPIVKEPSYFEAGFEEKDNLYHEINQLPLEMQHVIKLRFYEEMSLQEIAEITNTNLNTVKTRLYRGLKLLRQEVSYE